MGVPENVRKVPRPKNTIVVAYGKNKDRYAVKPRTGCERVDGKPHPKTGPTIGHIVNFVYVPDDGIPRISDDEIDIKAWGTTELCIRSSKDLLHDLKLVYSEEESLQLYCSAVLRACYPGIKDGSLKEAYSESFISEEFPGVGLSKNTFSDLLRRVGNADLKMRRFMKSRAGAVDPSHHCIIDSTLKRNKSTINSLAEFSRKKGSEYPMISLMYAFDLETAEVICMQVYPGNMTDSKAFGDFIRANGIKNGMIVADKGFPPSTAKEEFESNPGLHYLIPLKNGNSMIGRYGMLEFNVPVKGYDGVLGKKLFIGDRWLYAFRDIGLAMRDEAAYIGGNRDDFDTWNYEKCRPAFGTIVFESDTELELEEAYKAYDARWMIELTFRMYKVSEELDTTREHGDRSVTASEFVNFLATVMACRMFKIMDGSGLLERMTYSDVLRALAKAQKQREEEGTWSLRKMIDRDADVVASLGLVSVPIKVKNPVGRPKKRRS